MAHWIALVWGVQAEEDDRCTNNHTPIPLTTAFSSLLSVVSTEFIPFPRIFRPNNRLGLLPGMGLQSNTPSQKDRKLKVCAQPQMQGFTIFLPGLPVERVCPHWRPQVGSLPHW